MDSKTLSDWVTADATVVSIALTIVALVQLRGLRQQLANEASEANVAAERERRSYTLHAIQRSESDTILQQAFKTVSDAVKGQPDYTPTQDCKFHVSAILNYYEGIAIGIAQNIYVEAMAKDYLEDSVKRAVEIWLIRNSPPIVCPAAMFDDREFIQLRQLYNRWFPNKPVSYVAPK